MASYVVVWAMMAFTFIAITIHSPSEWVEYLIATVGMGLFISMLGSGDKSK